MPQTHDIVLWGQGEMHLRVALERLQRPLRRQRQIAAAGDRLSGDHPQIDHPARPAQEAVRRPRPVRRRRAGGQADAARRRFRIPRKGGRRRGAAQLHRRGGGGRGRRAVARAARLSRHRRAGDADRRLLSQRRFLRSRVPHRGADRRLRSAAAVPAGAAGADPCGRDRLSDRSHRQDQRHPVGTARARFSASTPARAGRDGTASAP